MYYKVSKALSVSLLCSISTAVKKTWRPISSHATVENIGFSETSSQLNRLGPKLCFWHFGIGGKNVAHLLTDKRIRIYQSDWATIISESYGFFTKLETVVFSNRKAILRNFAKSTNPFIKKETPTQVFSCKFCEYFQYTFLKEDLLCECFWNNP